MTGVGQLLFSAADLHRFASAALGKVGMPADRAACIASILLEGDLLGHDTHGLALLAGYIAEIRSGSMATSVDWQRVSDSGPCTAWDGHRLPGPWLVQEAINEGIPRARQFGSYTVAIRRSHHVACLAAYLKPVTDLGLFILLTSSDPAVASVAPFGSTQRLYTPNPIAAGIPTASDPILIDVSMSATTNGMTARLHAEQGLLPHAWILDGAGAATRDPAAYFADPPGSILPLGGLDSGHKGFALGLLVEALTSGLAGFGRADAPTQWGASIFLMILDPERFGGREPFLRETGFLASQARDATPINPDRPVRMPGERALRLRESQLQNGVALHQRLVAALTTLGETLQLPLPGAILPA